MRTLAALLFSLSLTASAQNWALLNPVYKYNYSTDGTDTISNQVFVTHIDTLGPDSFRYELNRIGVAIDTCAFWTGLCLLAEHDQFMGHHIAMNGDEWALETDSTTFIIRPLAPIGESWVYDTLNGTTATVSAIVEGTVLGETDSVKTIQLSTNDSIVITRDHGVIRYPAGNIEQRSIGIEGLGIGTRMPTIQELFGLSTGDIIQYRKYTFHFDMGPGQDVTEGHYKYVITARQEFPDSVILDHTYLGTSSHQYNTDPPYISWSSGSDSWTLPGGPFPFAELATTYPQGVVRSMAWGYPAQYIAIADLRLLQGGSRALRTDKFYWETILVGPDTYQEIYLNPGHAEYREPFGFYGYSFHRQSESCCLWDYVFEMEGAVISGDTIGTILPDSTFHVGINEAEQTVSFDVLGSPSSGSLTITSPAPLNSWVITDALGRAVVLRERPALTETISTVSLPSGMYQVSAFDPHGRSTRRFLIAH